MRLKDKVAVVTGAAQGIGRAIALAMGREGAKVIVADLQAEKAQSVANELQALGAEALAVEVNIANETSVGRMAKSTFEHFHRADILVNVAGIYYPKASVVDLSEEDWDRTINVNVGSNFLCCREFVPAMRVRRADESSASPGHRPLRHAPVPPPRPAAGWVSSNPRPRSRCRQHHRQRHLPRLGQYFHATPTPLGRRSDGASARNAAAAHSRTGRYRWCDPFPRQRRRGVYHRAVV